ncbi:hypothetical protein QTP70_023537 [Hemibagrus guttatus]|uniref:Immunoglobulin V-set domain-containing protein n=1 Tax=Hemibagrus guttatus TaxID=175788 RepID=A0AAE0R814_9TELE|nr:hypothetical protein QTP70_023537 [Hemibagrus guttatus]
MFLEHLYYVQVNLVENDFIFFPPAVHIYRQSLGEKPYVIATSYQFQSAMFYNNFDKNGRFSATIGTFSFNLSISNLKLSDSATYYCAITFLYDITFEQGTVLIVKDRSLKSSTLIQKNKLVGSGDSGTQCTLVTDRCAGNHSIFWFRHRSGESQPGIIYTQGQSSDHCKKSFSDGSLTQTCVYSLPKNLSLSNTGTYYCAVAACGEILFENKINQIVTDAQFQIKLLVLLSIVRAAVIVFVFAVCLLYICTRH